MEQRSHCFNEGKRIVGNDFFLLERDISFRDMVLMANYFFASGHFFVKTCCTKTTNLYNYQHMNWFCSMLNVGNG